MKGLTICRFPALSYACSEAINTLCTNLSFTGENMKRIMITSSHAAEGKSFLAMNVMRTMARLGKSVVLVDADLRRSAIMAHYGVQGENEKEPVKGLSHFLAGMVSEDEILYHTGIEGAYMIPVGRAVSNPLPLLVSPRFGELLERLARQVDYVIVDAPPLGAVIDAAEIAKACDGSLIVVGSNAVHKRELIGVKEQLEQTGCPILGTVLNQVEFDNYMSRKYYYYKSYGYKKYGSYYYANDGHDAASGGRRGGKAKSKEK